MVIIIESKIIGLGSAGCHIVNYHIIKNLGVDFVFDSDEEIINSSTVPKQNPIHQVTRGYGAAFWI
jgi:hypothetical protein